MLPRIFIPKEYQLSPENISSSPENKKSSPFSIVLMGNINFFILKCFRSLVDILNLPNSNVCSNEVDRRFYLASLAREASCRYGPVAKVAHEADGTRLVAEVCLRAHHCGRGRTCC